MFSSNSRSWLGALAVALIAACDSSTAPQEGTSFEVIHSIFQEACSGCHGAGSGRMFLTTMDSAQLVSSGLVDPSNPAQSLLNLKPMNLVAHGGGLVAAYTTAHQAKVNEWIAGLPAVAPNLVEAMKVGAGTNFAAPVIDGFFDAAWGAITAVPLRITGGWGEAEFVNVKAAYDGTYLYMLISWRDDKASVRRQPWLKQADGSWKVMDAKLPAPTDGMSWATYMGNGIDEEDPARFNYEDKLALIWNTYGPSTVAGFEESGCAVLCHDPSQGNRPGSTYFSSQGWNASKKYTNAPSEIADMWHWKLVRNNQHYKADDQYVGYWVPGPTGAADGGRHGDTGGAGYGNNGTTLPLYRGPSTTVPPYYIYDNQKVLLTTNELSAMAPGSEIANMITMGPSGFRADVDARGLYNTEGWTLELRRKLLTGDPNDVQFDDLTRKYAFGVAVFDNAQIEHRYMPQVTKLVFKP